MSITLIIIIITVLVSYSALNNTKIDNDLIFYPTSINYSRQWYRFFSHGLIHANWLHLGLNMYALYLFGRTVEDKFTYTVFQEKGKLMFLLLYVSALFFAALPLYLKHKDDSGYAARGASGAVAAVVFAFILLDPVRGIGIILIPVYIPGFIFGFLYLGLSAYMDKRGGGNIAHGAHFWGSVYGLIFVIVMAGLFSDYPVLRMFVEQVKDYLHLS
jgi:membrane associated rhomboid family serine protease